ncbi:Porin, LamB type [Candidatus Magnetomorum sp. HK-1]|nr:Porin, LamB type [Candidatus Magnetomorum sp. HK-1]
MYQEIKKFSKKLRVIIFIQSFLCLLYSFAIAQNSEDEIMRLQRQIQKLEKRMSHMEEESKKDVHNKTPQKSRFEYHGYMRIGAGINGEGGDQEVYQAPGAGAKYRLGNENDHYGEFELVNNWLNTDTNHDASFKTCLMVAYGSNQNANYDDERWFKLPQAYVQAGNVIPAMPEMKFWVGNRFYRRHDIHMNDFYFLSMSGHGGGIEDINIGLGKVAIAYMIGSNDSEPYYKFKNTGRVAKNTVDIRLYDIDLPFGTGVFQISPSWVKGGFYEINDENENTIHKKFNDTSGFGVSFFYTINNFLGGFDKFTLQFGSGSSYDFSPNIYFNNTEGDIDVDDKSTFRITNQFAICPMKKLSMMSAFVFEKRDTGAKKDAGETWISFGIRKILHFTDYISLAFESGIDWTDIEKDDISGSLIKFTIAPQIQVPGNSWARPVIRSFVTYAIWSDEFEGKVAPDAYANETSGLSFGLQLESWW